MGVTGTLALALTITFSQTGTLQISNVRSTHGMYGPPRDGARILPGELLFVSFDIAGLKPNADNNIVFTSEMEIKDSTGKEIHKKDLGEVLFGNILGGTKTPHTALVRIPIGFKADTYQLTVNVTDGIGKGKGSLSYKFEVVAPELGFVQFQISQDMGNLIRAPYTAAVGQALFVNAAVTGFKRGTDQNADISVEMRVLDEKGVATAPKPFAKTFKNISKNDQLWHVQFDLPVNRAGQFKIELKATDLNDPKKKAAVLVVPFVAVEQK